MSLTHYTNHGTIEEAIIGFSKVCRENDVGIGLNHTLEAMKVANVGFHLSEDSLRYSLRSLFCTCPEEYEAFDKCFDVFWLKRKHNYAHKFKNGQSNIAKRTNSSLVMAGFSPKGSKREAENLEEAKRVTGASKIEALKNTDFSLVNRMDRDFLDALSKQLIRQLNTRLKRKREVAKKGEIDIRKTIRANVSKGEMMDLRRKKRKVEKQRIILLLDVSGSMDRYSFFLLKFIWALKENLGQIDAFVFSTKLVRISDHLNQSELDEALWQLSINTDNWSSGTKIGECLKDFNNRYAKRSLNGRNVVIVLSDGLDNGAPELLASELQKIKLRTSKLAWLNPLKSMNGYEPTASGMNAALPYLDHFETAHNLTSLMKLEDLLADV